MEEIKITLETLYDTLRNEKKREDLQKLEATFYVDVVAYLREKMSLLADQKDSENPFATGEKEKLEYELRSIRRILKEIHEKREKKIIDIALNKSRTGSDIIDISSMLREEKNFYSKVLSGLNEHRMGVLARLFKGQLPEVSSRINVNVTKPEVRKTPVPKKEKETQVETQEPKKEEENKKEPTQEKGKAKIKFLHPVPSFVWKDMKVYGPFKEGEETEMFPEVADLLVRKGRAQMV